MACLHLPLWLALGRKSARLPPAGSSSHHCMPAHKRTASPASLPGHLPPSWLGWRRRRKEEETHPLTAHCSVPFPLPPSSFLLSCLQAEEKEGREEGEGHGLCMPLCFTHTYYACHMLLPSFGEGRPSSSHLFLPLLCRRGPEKKEEFLGKVGGRKDAFCAHLTCTHACAAHSFIFHFSSFAISLAASPHLPLAHTHAS